MSSACKRTSSSATLKTKVEEALYQVAPDLREIVVEHVEVEGVATSPQLVVLQ